MEFRVLGSLEVSEAGSGPIPLGGPKQRAVLAHLLLRANHLVPTEVLIDEVWGETPPEAVRNSLQTYVSHLRKALGPGRLEGSRAGYLLRADPTEVDVTRFQALLRDARRLLPLDPKAAVASFDHALALWRGPAFADLADERSLRAEAARIEELRLAAIEDRIEAKLALGEHAEVIGELQTLVAAHPLRERPWGQLMLALYRAGRQAEALAVYQRARETLVEELGIDPSPELRALHERILQQSPDLDLRGEPLRGYRLLEQIGEGSLGALYRATQPHVGREVAVRVIPERLAGDPGFIRRFEPEAQAIAALEHPHVAPVYDYWREPGRAYVVTRFLRGGSLRELLDRGTPSDRERTTRAVEHVASALAAAHRRGIAHGDLVASNVLLDEEGNAFLTDFRIGTGDASIPDDIAALRDLAHELFGDHAPAAIDDLLRTEGRHGPARTPTVVRNPYKGLRPFLEIDADDFHGREAFVARLIERMGRREAPRFLAVVGPSGSGKSSAVRAGLVPELGRGAIRGSDSWLVTEMHPGRYPIEELEAALLRIAVRSPVGLIGRLRSGPRGLVEAVNGIVPDGTELVLVVDQLEEAFTLIEDEAERALFLESLRVATVDPATRMRAIVTLRADFYDRPLMYPRIGELLGSCTEVVSPLTPDELERAIVRPAERVGLSVEPGLVAQIAADAAEQPGALPMFQFSLTELFDRRQDGRLTLDAYREVGGIAGALAARAEQLYGSREASGREAVRQLFLRLVTLREGEADTRRRVPLPELWSLEVDPEAMRSAVDAFGRHRLLTFDRDPATREPTVEVAHEALLGAWDRLGAWIDDAREDVRLHRRLAEASTEWARYDRDPSFLFSGSRLDQFDSWARATTLAIGPAEREYLRASVAERDEDLAAEEARRERERRLEGRSVKRLRALVAVLSGAVLVAGTLTAIAIDRNASAHRASRLATARELAGAALSAVESDRQLAGLLALESIETTEGDGIVVPDAELSLRRSFPSLTIESLGGFLEVSLTPDLGRVAIVGETGPTAVWELAAGQPGRRVFTVPAEVRAAGDCPDPSADEPYPLCDAVFHLALSPDGSLLATGHGDRFVRVWDLTTGRQTLEIDEHAKLPPPSDPMVDGHSLPLGDIIAPSVGFDPDGRYLWSQAFPGDLVLWEAASGDEVVRAPCRLALCTVPFKATVSFSDVGALAAIGGLSGLEIWDLEARQRAASLPGWWAAGFVPGRHVVWVADWQQLFLLDVSDGSRTDVPGFSVAHAFETDPAFSSDGARIAGGTLEGTVHVREAATGEHVTLGPNLGPVTAIAWSPDSRLLAAAGGDETVRLWDVDSGEVTVRIPVGAGTVKTLTFTADGARLAVASDTGTVRLHTVSLADQIQLASDRLVRDFTDQECRQYLHLPSCPT